MEVAAVHVEVPRAHSLGPQPVEQGHLGAARDAHCGQNNQSQVHSESTVVTQAADGGNDLRSAFFSDCFFLEGLLMTFIRLEWNTPMSWPLPKNILTVSIKCFRLSESEMNSVLAAQYCCKWRDSAPRQRFCLQF